MSSVVLVDDKLILLGRNMGAANHGGSTPGSPEGTMPGGMAWGPYHYRLLCIRFLIIGETHINATKLGGHPMHLGNADSWHHFRSSRLLPDRLLGCSAVACRPVYVPPLLWFRRSVVEDRIEHEQG